MKNKTLTRDGNIEKEPGFLLKNKWEMHDFMALFSSSVNLKDTSTKKHTLDEYEKVVRYLIYPSYIKRDVYLSLLKITQEDS